MSGSRTIKTLTVLLVAMTLGAFSLMLLQNASVRLNGHLAAVTESGDVISRNVRKTDAPINLNKWKKIIVGSAPSVSQGLHKRYHFLIDYDARTGQTKVIPTALWNNQQEGRIISIRGFDFDRMSIGICLIGDFEAAGPPRGQYAAVLQLTRCVQEILDVPASQVYLLSDLSSRIDSPGAAFPAQHFRNALRR